MKLSPPLRVLLRGIIGILIFFILLGIGNFLKPYISHPFYHFFIDTFNTAAWIIVLLSILFLAADIFRALKFPYNLPYPLLNGFAYAYLVSLLMEFIIQIQQMTQSEIPLDFKVTTWVAIFLVFALAIIVGYTKIYRRQKNRKPKI